MQKLTVFLKGIWLRSEKQKDYFMRKRNFSMKRKRNFIYENNKYNSEEFYINPAFKRLTVALKCKIKRIIAGVWIWITLWINVMKCNKKCLIL